MFRARILTCLALGVLAGGLAPAAFAQQLRVGAARVDMTPDAAHMPPPFLSVHDPVFVRAIYLENGTSSALLMTVPVGKIRQEVFDAVSREIARRLHVPVENMVISATHVHSNQADLGAPVSGLSPEQSANLNAYVKHVSEAMVQAAGKAKVASQPAELGYGEGKLYLNVNRDAIDPKTRQWSQEANLDYPSDKTFAVIEFRKANGGAPIASYSNYAMHANTMFLRGEVSGDYPEVASRYLEDNYEGGFVALWSSGAAGDQNPLYWRAITVIDTAQIKNEMDPASPPDKQAGEGVGAMLRLMFGGARRAPAPLDPKLERQSWQVVQAMGTLTAEETIRVIDGIGVFQTTAVLQGSSKSLVCPGRARIPGVDGAPPTFGDGPDNHIDVGALRIGDIAIGRVNAEIYNKIGQDIKGGSPFRHTLVTALANGEADTEYIPSDDAFGRTTFEVQGTHLKPGCAEMAIANGIDDLLVQDLK